jgi:hypothetical protein
MEAWQFIERLAPRASIAHHIPGRIRFKLDIGAAELSGLDALRPERLRDALNDIRGVSAVRLNLPARSCTVEYDAGAIPPQAWEDLLACRETPEAQILVDILRE